MVNSEYMLRSSEGLSEGVGLAPMEGVSDFPMRLWMSLTSQPAFQVTPFLRVTRTFPKRIPLNWAPELLIEGLSDCLPYTLVPQLMSPEPAPFIEVAKKVLQHAPFVELNCGCPAPVVVGKGAGSGLLRNPSDFCDFISTASSELGDEKLAIKIRTGFDSSDNYASLIEALQGLKLRRLTIHGRTRAQKYRGYADWDKILYAAAQLKIPVHGSGDITDSACLEDRLSSKHLLAGIIVGRGALRNPWIFEELRTGVSALIEGRVLLKAVECYGLILELFSVAPERLYECCMGGFFKKSLGFEYHSWEDFGVKIKRKLPNDQGSIISKKSLGKVKMLWNYLRSSLPAPLFEPKILRSSNFEDFLAGIEGRLCALDDQLPLKWKPDLDWVYAGEKRPESRAVANNSN